MVDRIVARKGQDIIGGGALQRNSAPYTNGTQKPYMVVYSPFNASVPRGKGGQVCEYRPVWFSYRVPGQVGLQRERLHPKWGDAELFVRCWSPRLLLCCIAGSSVSMACAFRKLSSGLR